MERHDIAILGSSATGISLALACAEAGLHVSVCEPDPHARDRAQVFARKDNADIAARITFADSYVVAEDAGLLFDALEPEERSAVQITPDPLAVLATPFATPLGLGAPGQHVRVVPFQPMQLRHLTELMAFPDTSDATLNQAKALADAIGRVAVILPPGTHSVGLRLLDRLHTAADQLLLEGAVLWELDEAMTAFGFDLGLYETQDLTGLDVAYTRRKAQGTPSLIADRAVEEGRIGKKIGWGWYRYPGGGGAVIDPLIEDLIREEAWFAKTPQHVFLGEQMLERLLNTLLEETTAILAEQQVRSPADLARILVHGLGFPTGKLDRLGLPGPEDQCGSSAG